MPGGATLRRAKIGLGLVLACACALGAPRANAQAAGASATGAIIYWKNRSFRIPFTVNEADRPRIREIQLWVSQDSGYTWQMIDRTSPDRPAFTYRAARDAEYWFAVRTIDMKGKANPPDEKIAEPGLRVIIDTNPPSLTLEPQGRRGSQASVRWEVRDENLDLPTFALEYQAEGAGTWRQVPLRRVALVGQQSWDAGTADRLKVRASVADKSGNVQQVEITLPDGTPANPDLAGNSDLPGFSTPPPIQPVPSAGTAFPGGDDPPRSPPGQNAGADPFDSAPPSAPAVNPEDAADPFAAASAPAQGRMPNGGGTRGPAETLLVGSPRFPLQYAVDDAGPNGPAIVELWITRDGGRTWSRQAEDSDRVSPYMVDLSSLGGDGTYGLSLVARSASGLGDQPPAPGEPPQTWVEIDATPPVVQLDPVKVGTGQNAGKIAILWRATDAHLAAHPVIISVRSDQPGAPWQPITDRIDNTGRYIWTVPANFPPRFHLRVDAIDTLGNRGFAETTESGPILVDRTRPRGRIIGLDPSARSGPAARPLR